MCVGNVVHSKRVPYTPIYIHTLIHLFVLKGPRTLRPILQAHVPDLRVFWDSAYITYSSQNGGQVYSDAYYGKNPTIDTNNIVNLGKSHFGVQGLGPTGSE